MGNASEGIACQDLLSPAQFGSQGTMAEQGGLR
jgi:hypothetical protein